MADVINEVFCRWKENAVSRTIQLLLSVVTIQSHALYIIPERSYDVLFFFEVFPHVFADIKNGESIKYLKEGPVFSSLLSWKKISKASENLS